MERKAGCYQSVKRGLGLETLMFAIAGLYGGIKPSLGCCSKLQQGTMGLEGAA